MWSAGLAVSPLDSSCVDVAGLEGGSGRAGLGFFVECHLLGERSAADVGATSVDPAPLTVVGHSGEQNGFVCHLYVNADAGSGFVTACNTTRVDGTAAGVRPGDGKAADFVVCQRTMRALWR